MKFGQSIEYNMRNRFVGKSHTKYDGEDIPTPFSKKSLDLRFYGVCSYCMLI